jgi:aminopeptidase N
MSKPISARSTTLFFLILAATALPLHAQQDGPVSSPRAEDPFLSQEAAAERSARVANVAYVLDYTLTGEPTFRATTKIDFDLGDTSTPLTVDLDKAKISALTVNGRTLVAKYNQWFITLDPADLKRGRNSVSVSFEREHSTNGEGLHRFKDPTDGRVYLYSHFEPAAAHQMFAAFDQPDLKATYQLTATAPKDWHIISSTRESRIEDLGANRRWTFPTTPKLSPYNFSMHAGPYQMWEDNSGKYPMRLFARQSVAAQVSPQDWFRYTKQGLVHFDEYFGIPYPFEKYDQILVPQFIYGAMENAAAVTFTEGRFLHDSAMTIEERQRLASTILHEMAHQWFGDLVTMRWWNGLWLNESFASYMATLGSAKSGEFEFPWLSLYQSKQNAYRTDERITTHPIEVPVPSTANAFDNIDAITYNKGASVLHQLRHMIGEETFRRGVHDYLTAHSYDNATLDDFIGALSNASGRDLRPWSQQWLYQPGLNTLSADFECANGKLSRFGLQQSAANAAHPSLREQLVQVGLFNVSGDRLVLSRKQAVTYQGASTDVPALVGQACPDLVYPNYEDWGFAKIVLDPTSFATARTHLTRIDDPMLRSMLWQSLYDGLRDRRLGLDDFIDIVLANVPRETDYTLLRQALDYSGTAKDYLRVFATNNVGAASAAISAHARSISSRMEAVLWTGLLTNRTDRDRAKAWLETYVYVASSDVALARLNDVLQGKADAGGVELDQELRWAIIEQLNRHAIPGSEALIADELSRDKTEIGQLSALSASAVRPDASTKSTWLAKIHAFDGSEPYSRLRVAMGNLYPAGQESLAEQTADSRMQSLPQTDKAADPVFMRSYSATMIPKTCNTASVARLERAIAASDALSAGVRRALLSAREDEQRCVAIRSRFESGKF